MTPATSFSGREVALFGLGGSGLASARALVAGGARVACFDDNPSGIEAAGAAGLAVEDLRAADFSRFAALVLTPGVPLTHPAPHWSVGKARAAGVEIIGDIELFCRERAKSAPRAPFIAVTGTNGKSTTTALIAHLLRAFAIRVEMGGNIGTPILALAPPSPERTHVVEVSSFQIDLAPSLAPSVGVLLNVTPDHLDRHGTFENYASLKERVVARADAAVIAIDDQTTQAIAERLRLAGRRGTSVSVTRRDLAEGIVVEGTRLVRHVAGREVPIADLAGIPSLRGRHNAQNAAAAVAALGRHGFAHDIVAGALKTFPGLPHRMEEVARVGRVVVVNDSKATNADAAAQALACFDTIFWIAGGRAKEGGIASLRPYFGRVAREILRRLADQIGARELADAVPHVIAGTIERALELALADACASDAREPAVLLSPACASYDQFANFEARGDHFRERARALAAQFSPAGVQA